ncbi:MAG: hypothetical protein EOO38_05945 [Cytophagaceae bacterium]|nr:MAG: hypothetical protein EOO38_05945 [Cytophagaceae bacterium]
MGYQFVHVESYARKAGKGKAGEHSLDTIAAEADRLPDNSPHVITPKPPKLLYGVSAVEVAEIAKSWADNSKDSRGHKLRQDGLCLLAGVISVPDEFEEWKAYKKESFKWLKDKYGDRLRSVIEHTDENHRHIHFYVVPNLGERFEDIHQGKKAASEVKNLVCDEKDPANKKGAQNTAYTEAMRAYQDEFSNRVAMGFGLTKIGPGRRRLTRSEWHQEKSQAAFFASSEQQHKAGRNKGYEDGYKQAQEAVEKETERVAERAGTLIASVAKAVVSKWHKPTLDAAAQATEARKKAKEERAKRRSVEVTLQAKLDRLTATHQAEVEKLKRIAQNAEKEADEANLKLASLAHEKDPRNSRRANLDK